MPVIRSVEISNTQFKLTDKGGAKTLLISAIPPNQNTITKIENYVNNTWIPANITDYQARIHVFSLNPLKYTIGTFNLGDNIPSDWWVE